MPKPRINASLSASVYDAIRGRILSGEYRLGHPLSRRKLAEEFEVSLIPVAEALLRLQTEGFVESRPRVGTRVKMPTGDEVRGRYIVREALESQSARLYAAMATPRQKDELMRRARRVDALALRIGRNPTSREVHLEYEKTHVGFHMRLAECSRCHELVEAIEKSRVLVFNWLFGVTTQLEPTPVGWHEGLMMELNRGEIDRADQAMRLHVRFRMDEVVMRVESFLLGNRDHDRILRGPQRRTLEKMKASD